MVDPVLLLAFIPAALALNMTPGADMMFAFAQGMKGGARAAISAAAGISTGVLVHVLLAGLGLGALVTAFPWLFGAIRWVGAAYLLWLAWKTLNTPFEFEAGGLDRSSRAFRDGLVVNLSNPKVVLFILAFLPQFVDTARAVLPQFLAYGCILAVGGFVMNGLAGIFAGRARRLFLTRPRAERGLRIASASIYSALAARIGWEAVRP